MYDYGQLAVRLSHPPNDGRKVTSASGSVRYSPPDISTGNCLDALFTRSERDVSVGFPTDRFPTKNVLAGC